MGKNIKRYSRHIYDLYMLWPKMNLDDNYKSLVSEIREHRAKMAICLSAQTDVNIPRLLEEIIEKDIYKDDYREITTYFQNEPLEYDRAISVIKKNAESGIF